MKLRNLKDKDAWMLGEDIPDCDLFFSQIWLNCFVNRFQKHTGRAYQKILCKYSGYHLWFYFGENDSNTVAENIVKRIITEPGYAKNVNDNIIKQAGKLRAYCKTIPDKNLDKLSNEKLWQIYEGHNQIHQEYYTWCWIPVAADMFHNNLTRRLKEILRKHDVPEEKINEYLVILTQPLKKSLIMTEQESLLKIAVVIEKDDKLKKIFLVENEEEIIAALPKPILTAISRHYRNYFYTKHLWVEGEYTLGVYIKQLQDMLSDGDAKKLLVKTKNDLVTARIKKQTLIKKIKLPKNLQNIFGAFADFMVTKIYRRYAQIFAVYKMTAILKEIARRNQLAEKQVRFILPSEIKDLLLSGKKDESSLSARTKTCVYYAEKNAEQIFIGKEAEALMKRVIRKVDQNIRELRGEIGCPGQAVGRVKIIIRAADMEKMNMGDILVSIATDPDIVPAMRKAAAIVTEQGGVTSHAAIVSRELGVPCVIGTKIATKIFKDGDVVEVDADKGVVRKIK